MSRRVNGVVLCILAGFLAGCSPLKLAKDAQQADPVDFGELYNGAMVAKYKVSVDGSTRFDKLLQAYDDAETRRATLEKRHRESELEQRTVLQQQFDMLRSPIEEAITVSIAEKKAKNIAASNVALVDKKMTELAKKPAGEERDQEMTRLEIDRTNYQAQEQFANAKVTLHESELIRLRASQVRLTTAIAELDKDDDPVDIEKCVIRDLIIKDYLALADANYLKFKNELLTGRAATDTVGDIAELLLSTAATLTGGVTSKTNLAAASTLLKGSRATVDKNFFAQQTMRAIINSIEAGRASDRRLINEKLKKSAAEYPLSEAIAEAQHYQSRASLSSAILDIANQTGTNAALQTFQLNQQSAPGLNPPPAAVPTP